MLNAFATGPNAARNITLQFAPIQAHQAILPSTVHGRTHIRSFIYSALGCPAQLQYRPLRGQVMPSTRIAGTATLIIKLRSTWQRTIQGRSSVMEVKLRHGGFARPDLSPQAGQRRKAKFATFSPKREFVNRMMSENLKSLE